MFVRLSVKQFIAQSSSFYVRFRLGSNLIFAISRSTTSLVCSFFSKCCFLSVFHKHHQLSSSSNWFSKEFPHIVFFFVFILMFIWSSLVAVYEYSDDKVAVLSFWSTSVCEASLPNFNCSWVWRGSPSPGVTSSRYKLPSLYYPGTQRTRTAATTNAAKVFRCFSTSFTVVYVL